MEDIQIRLLALDLAVKAFGGDHPPEAIANAAEVFLDFLTDTDEV